VGVALFEKSGLIKLMNPPAQAPPYHETPRKRRSISSSAASAAATHRTFQLMRQDVCPDELFDKATNTPTANDSMESVVHGLVEGDCQLLLHQGMIQEVHVLYTYSISSWNTVKSHAENSQR
jgi:hypothetical protein